MPLVQAEAAAERKPMSDWVVRNRQPLRTRSTLTRHVAIAAAAGELAVLAAGGDELAPAPRPAPDRRTCRACPYWRAGRCCRDAARRRRRPRRSPSTFSNPSTVWIMQTRRHASLSCGTLSRERHRAIVELRITGGDRAFAERRELADIDRLFRLRGIGDVRTITPSASSCQMFARGTSQSTSSACCAAYSMPVGKNGSST